MIERATQRASNMIDDLLRLARETAPMPGVHETSDPQRVVRDAIGARSLDAARVSVRGEWAPVAIASDHLTVVIDNIVANASHYGRDPDGLLRLDVVACERDRTLHIAVVDHGRGLSDGDRDGDLFLPFRRGHDAAARNPYSTGVGLALVRRILRSYGGDISHEPTVPTGATFRATVPVAATHPEQCGAPGADRSARQGAFDRVTRDSERVDPVDAG